MVKRGPNPRDEELLKIWNNSPNNELRFSDIVKEAEKLGFKKATTVNYLNTLVKKQILEKRIDEQRNTWYKLKDRKEFLKAVLKGKIDKMDEECLRMLDTFSLLLLTEQYKSIQKNQSKKFFEITENVKQMFLAIRHAQNMIRQAVESIEKEKLKASA